MNLMISTNRWGYNGKEKQTVRGLNFLDYGARMYDDFLGRWFVIDRFAEKYYSLSPYCYAALNPINNIDINGDSISVAMEHREQFMTDMRNIFGDKASSLSFNENGNLILNEKTKDFTKGMTKDQKQTFKGLSKAMDDKQTTTVVYANTQDLTVDGQTKSVDIVKEFGGGVYSKTDNMIVIAPNVGTVNVTLDEMQFVNGKIGFSTQDVQQNTTSTLFHEIGEINTKSNSYRGKVIDYENHVRKIIGFPLRPFDLNHSKKVKTNYK
jgi:RHS repeat-associated protein